MGRPEKRSFFCLCAEPERARPLLERIVQWSHHSGFGEEALELMDEIEDQAKPDEEAQDRLRSGHQATP